MAQGFSYSFNKIDLDSNFQNNFKSWGVKLVWGLDGCARWRKVTDTVAVQLKLKSNCQTNLMSLGVILGWGLNGCAPLRQVTITFALNSRWGVILKIIHGVDE